jgi:large subunit ribosomal protein L1
MKKRLSKRFKKLIETTKDKKPLIIDDAISMVKNNCTTKFNESIDVSLSLNLVKKKEKFNLRTVANLPNGNGKKIRVAVLCE